MSKTTKIAIPEWQGCVSTVFDFANRLLLIDIDRKAEINRAEIALPDEPTLQRVTSLKNLGVDLLICGAISRPLAFMIAGLGIELLPYVSGRIDDVLNAYLTGRLTEQRFSMPGCRAGVRKGFGRGHRGRRRCRRRWHVV